jgi:hypothetical protein
MNGIIRVAALTALALTWIIESAATCRGAVSPSAGCQKNLREIGLHLKQYNQGTQYPAQLSEMATNLLKQKDAASFVAPDSGHKPGKLADVDQWTDYIYFGNLPDTLPDVHIPLVMCPPTNHNGQFGEVLWVDGSVDAIPTSVFNSLLANPFCLAINLDRQQADSLLKQITGNSSKYLEALGDAPTFTRNATPAQETQATNVPPEVPQVGIQLKQLDVRSPYSRPSVHFSLLVTNRSSSTRATIAADDIVGAVTTASLTASNSVVYQICEQLILDGVSWTDFKIYGHDTGPSGAARGAGVPRSPSSYFDLPPNTYFEIEFTQRAEFGCILPVNSDYLRDKVLTNKPVRLVYNISRNVSMSGGWGNHRIAAELSGYGEVPVVWDLPKFSR